MSIRSELETRRAELLHKLSLMQKDADKVQRDIAEIDELLGFDKAELRKADAPEREERMTMRRDDTEVQDLRRDLTRTTEVIDTALYMISQRLEQLEFSLPGSDEGSYEEGYTEGYDQGYTEGHAAGYDNGREDAYDEGHEDGYAEARSEFECCG